MEILKYPHPTLRHVSKPLKRVDAELRSQIAEMFELMYANNGIGLAANQVDLPYRLFVLNLKGDPRQGEELVFINPVIRGRSGLVENEEGCLSLPGLYADVKRAQSVTIHAYNLKGEEVREEVSGLYSRAVQHELDHLDGVLFIDRITPEELEEIAGGVHDFELEFNEQRLQGTMPSDEQIAARLAELERLRT